MTAPLFVRKLIVDFVEGFIAFLLAANLVFPTSVDQGRALLIAVGVGALDALVSAVRRNSPAALDWLRSLLNVPPNTPPSG